MDQTRTPQQQKPCRPKQLVLLTQAITFNTKICREQNRTSGKGLLL